MTSSIARRGLALAALLLAARPLVAQSRGDDTVLRLLIQGTSAFARGDTTAAAPPFEQAVALIGGIWGTTPEARQARSLWYEESVKPFRGDPYERVMAYYYRGLLYIQQRDWGNAQAAFRSSAEQDAFAEEDQYNDDVAAPVFLQALALQAQGSVNEAREAYKKLGIRRPDFVAPNADAPAPNLVLIAETGFGPRKVADGIGSYKLRLFRGKNFTEARAFVAVDTGAAMPLYPMEDVYWQAASRGGRQVDAIFEGKAKFADRNDIAGSTLTAVSSDLAMRKYLYDGSTAHSMSVASDASSVIGIAALALSVRAKPAVDTRYWDNLPDALHMAAMTVAPGRHHVRFTFRGPDGVELPQLEQNVDVLVGDAPGPTLAWASSRPRDSRYLTLAGKGKP